MLFFLFTPCFPALRSGSKFFILHSSFFIYFTIIFHEVPFCPSVAVRM